MVTKNRSLEKRELLLKQEEYGRIIDIEEAKKLILFGRPEASSFVEVFNKHVIPKIAIKHSEHSGTFLEEHLIIGKLKSDERIEVTLRQADACMMRSMLFIGFKYDGNDVNFTPKSPGSGKDKIEEKFPLFGKVGEYGALIQPTPRECILASGDFMAHPTIKVKDWRVGSVASQFHEEIDALDKKVGERLNVCVRTNAPKEIMRKDMADDVKVNAVR